MAASDPECVSMVCRREMEQTLQTPWIPNFGALGMFARQIGPLDGPRNDDLGRGGTLASLHLDRGWSTETLVKLGMDCGLPPFSFGACIDPLFF